MGSGRRRSSSPWWVALAAAGLLAAAAPVHAARPATAAASAAPAEADDAATGALIGDLVFHADLLAALDRLCPARTPAADWHAALASLLDEAFTPELRSLSQRLGSEAGQQIVAQRGGCHTRGFTAAYAESRDEYRELLRRWRALDD